jgi:signal transduction histidine kinase
LDEAEILREVMDRQPGAMIVFNRDFEVLWRNRAAVQYVPDAAPGVSLYKALEPCANEEKLDRMLLRTEKVMFPPDPDQPLLEWLVHHEPLSDGSQILMAWDPDITDEMVQRRATFSMAAAHELKSPLTALIGFTEILEMERSNLTPLQEEASEMILKNALYLQSLVNDILDLTSNSFGELKLELAPTDVGEAIRQVTDSLRLKIDDRGQSLTVEIEPGLPEIEADSRRIRQVVQNLVQNAHVHTGAGTAINVTAKTRDDGGLVIAVGDDGPGLPFDRPEDAFTSFRHAGTVSFENMTGSGIGLTVAKRVTELHRGIISVESERGKGTWFEVWLPLDRANTFTRTPPGPA